MRTLRSSAFILALCLAAACKEGDVDFDGFPEDDAGARGNNDAAATDDEDAGAADDDDGGAAAETDAGPTAPLAKIDEVSLQLAEALCDARTDCRGPELLNDYLTGQDCVSQRAARQEDGNQHYLADSVKKGRVVFQAAGFAKCKKDIVALGCDAELYRWPESCENALQGTVDLEGDCSIDLDCIGRAFCKKDAACPGTCAPLLAQGEACAGNNECEDGLGCLGKVCSKVGVEGDLCGVDLPPCGIAFMCHIEGSIRKCRDIESVYVGELGDSCASNAKLCKPSLVCASSTTATGKCEERSSSLGSCKRALPNQCPMDEYCDATGPGMAGLCTEYPADGETCVEGRDQVCGSGASCIAGKCQVLRRLDETCTKPEECYSGACDEVCVLSPLTCSL